MKICNWLRKLRALFVAFGMFVTAAAEAVKFDTELIVNGNFESVDLSTTGNYNGPRILGWNGPSMFAYSHNGSSSSAGVVLDLADGEDPPDAGNWYFSTNNTGTDSPPDIRDGGVYFQEFDVSTDPVAFWIAQGRVTYTASADFSSFQNDSDFGSILIENLDINGNLLFRNDVSDQDNGPANVWSHTSETWIITPGTKKLRVSLYGELGAGGRPGLDAYIDNVSFVLSRVIPEPSTIALSTCALVGVGAFRRRWSSRAAFLQFHGVGGSATTSSSSTSFIRTCK